MDDTKIINSLQLLLDQQFLDAAHIAIMKNIRLELLADKEMAHYDPCFLAALFLKYVTSRDIENYDNGTKDTDEELYREIYTRIRASIKRLPLFKRHIPRNFKHQ